jgi:cyanophycinase
MPDLFLHGGGDHSDYRAATFGRFLKACAAGEGLLALVVAAADEAAVAASYSDYAAIFAALGWPAERVRPLLLTPDRPLGAADLPASMCGLFVCGGETPLYHALLCADLAWLGALRAREAPYGGTSAGAMLAPSAAIIGGWQIERGDRPRQLVFPGAGEGLGPLSVRPGLGLTPFTVDVHAGQMGTLTRLVNAVAAGLAAEGWAIDEDTQLELAGAGGPRVVGRGQAYHVARTDDGLAVRVVAGE